MKKIIAAGFIIVTFMLMLMSTAFAEPALQDGIKVEFSSDKEKYSPRDSITAKLTVTNTNIFAVSDLALESVLPQDYKLAENYSGTMNSAKLEPGESFSFEVMYVPEKSSFWSAGNIILIAAIIVVIAAAVTVVVILRKKSKNKTNSTTSSLALILCAAAAVSLTGNLYASAQSNDIRTMEIENTVKVADKDLKIKAWLNYNYLEELGKKNIFFDLANVPYDKETKTYLLFDEKPELSGIIKNFKNLTEASYSISDSNGKTLMSGELPLTNNWTVDDLGLIVGENNIKVSLKYENGFEDSAEIKINNLCEKNMENLDVDRNDDDEDGVLNFSEELYHTDPKNPDTDGDGLSDYDEMAVTGTDPKLNDTDKNGVEDSKEDFDKDKISNYDEIYVNKTDPNIADSDGDGFSDYDEIFTYKTSPTNRDSDADEANDFWEIKNGFDPNAANKDFGDLNPPGKVIVNDDGAEITIAVDNAFLNKNTPGYIGSDPYQIELGEASSTSITIPYDASALSSQDEPVVYYFNEETQILEEVATKTTGDGKATATVKKSGTYILLNRREVFDVWDNDVIRPSEVNDDQNIDIVFVIDHSHSMDANDPNSLRKEVVKEFINKLRPQDRAAIVAFTAIAQTVMPITNDKEALINAVMGIQNSDGGGCAGTDQNAGTNGAAGIRNALDELKGSTSPHKYIIFLTDGDDTTTPEGYTYETLEKEALNSKVIIHTVGLVGTGGVNIELLKSIAHATKGNYYLATVGEAAENTPENVPEDALLLEDVYRDIETLTIDKVLDSNNDGISDYYTRMICEGKLVTSKGSLVFGSASYEDVQKNADYDGDGLLNGEEVVVSETASGVYVKVISFPYSADSDNDSLNDYLEQKTTGTSPLKVNSYVDVNDVYFLTNNENFLSTKYWSFYQNNCLERGAVFIGNAFFGSVFDQTSLYQAAIVKMFEDISGMEEELALQNNKETAAAFTSEIFNNYSEALVKAAENEDAQAFEELKGSLLNIIEVADTVINPDENLVGKNNAKWAINLITMADKSSVKYYCNLADEYLRSSQGFVKPDSWTNKRAIEYLNKLTQKYCDAKASAEELSESIDVKNAKFDKFFNKLSIAMSIVSVADSAVESYIEYNRLIANLETIQKNIELLDVIINTTTDNDYLLQAACNIKYYLNNIYENDFNTIAKWAIAVDYAMPALESALAEVIHNAIGNIVICGVPVGAIIELGRTVGNVFGNIDQMSIAAAQTVAYASMANKLSDFYINQLGYKDSSGQLQCVNNAKLSEEKIIAYSDFSEKLCTYLIDVGIAWKLAENAISDMNEGTEEVEAFCEANIKNIETRINSVKECLKKYYNACG